MYRTTPITLVLYVAGIAAIAGTAVIGALAERPVDHFTRDPMSVVGGRFYVGLLSNLTVMTWFMAAGAAWMTWITLRDTASNRRLASYAGALAALITLLGFDDLFMIHESALRDELGVPELLTYSVYGLFALGIMAAFWREARLTAWPLLIPTVCCFAGMLTIDIFVPGSPWWTFVEDSLKKLGVIGLATYVVSLGVQLQRQSTAVPA